MRVSRRVCAFLIIISILLTLCSCSKLKRVRSAADLSGSKVGVMLGSAAAGLTEEIESFGASVAFYSSTSALTADLKSGVIDCIITDKAPGEKLDSKSLRIKALDEEFLHSDYSMAQAKENADLTAAINRALTQLTESGTLQRIIDGYISGGDYKYAANRGSVPDGTALTLAVVPDDAPYAYYNEFGELVGLDIDVATAVCDILGVGLNIREEQRSGLVTSVQSGRADIAIGRLTKNETDAKYADFSEPYMTSVQIMLVRI